jgi:hypothetical protein
MSEEEMLEYARWLFTQKISGATRDFLENSFDWGISEDPQSPDNQRIRELMLLYPR